MIATSPKALRGDIGTVHFIGIGGIGMSGIAEVMKTLGYRVQGSDMAEGYTIARLREQGIAVFIGHKAENLGDAAVVVVSTAIKPGNPEVDLARSKHIPIVRRAEMLAELMRFKSTIAVAGTHGKTTTTSLVAAVLDRAGADPTVINGGIINAYGTNARLGAGEWMVVEADESDGSFLRLPATIGIITNIDPEHLDHYGSFDAVRAAFRNFVERVPFYGCAVMCIDHPEVQAMAGQIIDRRIITYGFNPQADVRLLDVVPVPGGNRFSVELFDRRSATKRIISDITLAMPGRHNVQNACAAIAVARELGLDDDSIRAALSAFGGVKRRFTRTGEVKGVTVIDDYGHHPVEIRAVLSAAREGAQGRVIAVVQPHRYSRLNDLMGDFATCFNDADLVIVAPVYAAGETPIAGASRDDLVERIRASGHRQVMALEGPEHLASLLAKHAKSGDMVICLGAGDITKWAAALPAQLEPLL
jgi:UDP-N-acetylmuramate--alanine ligase